MIEEISTALIALNNAQRGSLGEYLFAAVAGNIPGSRLETVRSEQTDFILAGERIDVKTTIRDLDRPIRPLTPYRGPRVSGVRYAQVEFSPDGVRISIESAVMTQITWPKMSLLWTQWINERRPRKSTPPDTARLNSLLEMIRNHFEHFAIEARILYRTGQANFGNESPANLLPKTARPNRITVFIDFHDQSIDAANIRRIVAFKDSDAPRLPMNSKIRLHRAKVDLAAIPQKYVFTTLGDLFERMLGYPNDLPAT